MSERRDAHQRQLDILASTDPALHRLINERVAAVAARLGESPEAWRGAEVIADELVEVLGYAITAAGSDEVIEQRARPLLVYVVAFATVVGLDPRTPWGQGQGPD